MAFISGIGNLLKQARSKQVNIESSAFNLPLYQAIRCMSSSKLFVGGISYNTDETSLRETFEQHGSVVEARIIMDRENGRSRGFGFVSFASSEDASKAMQSMDGQDLQGRRIRVNYATDRSRGGNFGGGSGYGDGGYSNYSGGGGGYGSGNYGGGGGGGGSNYGGGDGGYGSRNYDSGVNNYYGGGDGNYSSGVAGGGDNYFGVGAPGGDSGFSDAGYGSTTGMGGSNETFGNSGVDNFAPDDVANTRG